MKCSNCGLPLSPTRAACPRCGTPRPGKQGGAHTTNTAWSPQPVAFQTQVQVEHQHPFTGEPGQPERRTNISSPSWDFQGASVAQQTRNTPFEQPSVGFTPPMTVQPTFPATPPSGTPATTGTALPQERTPEPPRARFEAGQSNASRIRSARMGFSIAGGCLLMAALLLTFVYFMGTASSATTVNTGSTATNSLKFQKPAPTTTPSLPTPTPTPSFPGQQYIDGAQTASTITPLQPTSTFRVNQRIYVTLNVHANHDGAMCFHWLLNERELIKLYGIPVGANSPQSYSYAIYGSPGTGTVEIYWASGADCSDAVLAQKVTFTVNA